MREALDRLKRSDAPSEDDDNNDNGINNSNNRKNGDGNVWGRRREEISISRGDYPQNLLRLSVEESAVQCTLGEMSYVLEKIYGRHVPSSPIVLGSYIAYFCSGRGGGGDIGRRKKRYDNNDNDHDDK